MKTAGKLMYGIAVGDAIHYDYTVVLPVIRHTVNALGATFEAMGETDSPAAAMHYRAALMAEVMDTLGPLGKEEINAELLLDGLTDEDFDLIDAELAGLKKKRINSKPDLPDSEKPPLSSDSTASPPTP